MTYQEVLWQGKMVQVVSNLSRNKRVHKYVTRFYGLTGTVLREAKNGMLLIQFDFGNPIGIPAACLALVESPST
jgi:hypothetical protein